MATAARRAGTRSRGQVLVAVVMVLLVLLVIVPAVVTWVQQESRVSVKDQRSTLAFNLAEAAVQRGMWKLKSATSTWDAAVAGTPIAGYDFDATYRDISGGEYRIRFSSGANKTVTVAGEARTSQSGELRAIRAVYANRSLPGPVLTVGIVTYAGALEAHWGPVMAQNNINISGNAATEYFPRKFSKQAVTGTGGQPRDVNGITPPNTDNVEWWSDYDVPDVPLLDFATLRASAAANGTLNYYNGSSSSHTLTGYPAGSHGSCTAGSPHTTHFFDSNHHPRSKENLIWYWDGNLVLSGNMTSGCHRLGTWGTFIIRGNLTVASGDCYAFTGPVPAEAWREYARIRTATWDTATANQYPADNGFQTNRLTFNHGSATWTGGPPSANTDVAHRGLLYVGGNLTILTGALGDFHGVLWVNGNITNNNTGERSLIFYDDTLDVPILNVILVRQSWMETGPSALPWAP